MKLADAAFYIVVLVLSVLFLVIGNRITSSDLIEDEYSINMPHYSGIVVEVIERIESEDVWGFESTEIIFTVRLTGWERRGDIVLTTQQLFAYMAWGDEREVEAGDRVLVVYDSFNSRYYFANYSRINYILILGVAFLVTVLLFGRMKGFNAIVALGFTCMAVFWVFLPAILSGRNVYLTTIIVCCFSIVSTLLIVIGKNKKALSAILGCLGGVLLAAGLMFVMDAIMSLTGILDSETRSLLFLPTENPINLRAIIFAGVVIGAVGAIIDVAMSIASSLWEVKNVGGVEDFKGIVKSGINIGKDILGTMLNTLILAYIGSSLSLILLISVHSTSMLDLFNMELIIVEFLRALVGAFGMTLTIPLTAVICGWLYSKHQTHPDSV